MEKTIYKFIFRHSVRQQVSLLLLTLAAFPFLYLSLDLPKMIINKAINGKRFPQEFLWHEFDQIPYLLVLCGAFLILVMINGWFKYTINTMKGRLGERMLRRLRYELYGRVLRFPIPHFRKISAGEIIPMVTSEVETLGGFIGDSIALPLFQGGQLATIATFMFVQDWVLGLAAVSLYPLQIYVIPRLQAKVNALAKLRVREVRQLSDRIAQTISGIEEVRTNDGSGWRRADFTKILGEIYAIRFEIYQRKFFIKFLNNFIAQLTPFFFYTIGGYLIIKGDLSFGSMVAALAAYKDMSAPWRELLQFYQQKEDARIKYDQVVSQFDPPGILDPRLQDGTPEAVPPFPASAQVAVNAVSLVDEDGAPQLEAVTLTFGLDEHVAVIGPANGGKEDLALLLARLVPPTSGRITIAGQDVGQLPEAVLGRRAAYVGPTAHLFATSVRENLLFALRHRPLRDAPEERRTPPERIADAALAGNSVDDLEADLIDYEGAGVQGPADLDARLAHVLGRVGLSETIYELGLRGTIDPAIRGDLAERVLEARAALKTRLDDPALADLIEPFDPDRYNNNATMAENLLFGTPRGPALETQNLATNPYMRQVLERCGLTDDLVEMGRDIASIMVELFSGLEAGQELTERYSFIRAEDLPDYATIVQRAERVGTAALRPDERDMLLALPFQVVAAKHRLGLIDEAWEARLLEARRRFAADLPPQLAGAVEFFLPDRYNAAASIQDNILFGKVVTTQGQAAAKVSRLLADLISELGLHDTICSVGLDYQVGIGGSRLTIGQRQRVAIARALLKRPDLLILNNATASIEINAKAPLIDAVLEEMQGRAVAWVLEQPTLADRFDRVIVVKDRRVVDDGTYSQLATPGRPLAALIGSEQ